MAGLSEFLKPLNEVIVKVYGLTEGRRNDVFNHMKAAAESLTALAWMVYTGKDCGMNMPVAHVEESWQSAEFYNNKILVEYKGKDPSHVERAKSLKELYLPGLRNYVKEFLPHRSCLECYSEGDCFCSNKTFGTKSPLHLHRLHQLHLLLLNMLRLNHHVPRLEWQLFSGNWL